MRTVTLRDRDRLRVWATMTAEGELRIEGQDLGGYPGASEYEYAITVSATDLPIIRAALDASDDDLLSLLETAGEAIVRRGERAWIEGLGITAEFWSRVEPGDAPDPANPAVGEGEPAQVVPGPPPTGVETVESDDDEWFAPADRFTLSRAWWIAGQLVRRHPALMVSRVINEEKSPLVIVHDPAETTCIQFDLPAWIQYMTPEGLHRITWAEVFAATDPRAVVRTIETEAGIGAPIEAADSPQSLVYRTIACTLALGLDSTATWQAFPAWVDVMNPDETNWELFDAFPTGRALASGVIDAALDRVATGGDFTFHQPVWALLRDVEPVALLSVGGSVHTSTGEVDLAAAFEQAGRSISAMTAALFGDYLP